MDHRRIRLAGAFLAFALCVPSLVAAAQDEQPIEDNWYALFLMGQKAGYVHRSVFRHETGDGVQYQTLVHEELSISRLQQGMTVTADQDVWEDADGHVVRFRQVVGGAISMTQEGRVEGDKLIITSGPRGRASEVPRPDGLCPEALVRLQREKGYAAGTEYTVPMFMLDAPSRTWQANVKVVGEEEVPFFETEKRLNRVEVTVADRAGLLSTEWHDATGTVWAGRLAMGGIEVTILKAAPEVAKAHVAPAELMAATLVRPDRPIRNPRQLEGLQILMQPQKLAVDQLSVPEDTYQKVEKRPDGLLISVQMAHGHPELSYKLPYTGEQFADQTKSNNWLEADDPLVQRMAGEAVGDATDALTAAKRIEQYVGDAIVAKNLGVGMATAAETARSLEGDCTEHAVLVAGLARAAGLPSRVVAGMVYVDTLAGTPARAFGYHMWAEVWVGEWLPLDALIHPVDATHIALVRSDLNGPDDLFNIAAAVAQTIGAVKLSVIKTTY